MSEVLDLSKSYDFFQPDADDSALNFVGVGSVGSTLAENAARCGVKRFVLWDFDDVEPHNIVNQMFRQQDVGRKKVDALKDIILEINPEAEVKIKPNGWNGEMMSGYIFLAVDNIEIRKAIVEKIFDSVYVKAVFDFRTLLESAQSYAADWKDYKMKQNLLNSMQFSHEEAIEEAPVSACGITLGVATTVRLIAALGINNYINFVKGNGIKKFIQIDGFNYILDAF
jgi:hypothetical protein